MAELAQGYLFFRSPGGVKVVSSRLIQNRVEVEPAALNVRPDWAGPQCRALRNILDALITTSASRLSRRSSAMAKSNPRNGAGRANENARRCRRPQHAHHTAGRRRADTSPNRFDGLRLQQWQPLRSSQCIGIDAEFCSAPIKGPRRNSRGAGYKEQNGGRRRVVQDWCARSRWRCLCGALPGLYRRPRK